MRIVGGKHRGRRLAAPDGRDTRPTTDRTREAIFNILAHAEWAPAFEGVIAADVFCGTGALGLEALSRGAARCSFLDSGKPALDCVRANIAALGEADSAIVLRADATRPPPASAPCGLIFLDPPYAKGFAPLTLAALARTGWLADGALAVVEVGDRDPLPPPSGFTALDERRYGDTRVCFLGYSRNDGCG
ncbi:16S rRNA (guanine(966)-N(2))-methyltransferase RsmD [Azospirillum griseum]|uniref:16S rRNA (Guanine(966)-N(2))-methyltransferase RsmD n=1 Tax=Azospirillum griseum TaxID=2496639 RepID=A0A3S0HWU0_9PROT|nr:16S rRNA (guanine(966)-N(2))-methyltransferase RsmD [Azospirillum griseum]RTR19202.1 16S rRNA (guanine(966)-N(2))-methyltransferase RsmD [Azospirillum griseum]